MPLLNPITWLHKLVVLVWILGLSLFAFGIAGAQTSGVRYVSGQLGILQRRFGQGIQWLTERTFQAIFTPVKVQALFGGGDIVIDLAQVLENTLAKVAKQILNSLVTSIMNTFSALTRSLLRGLQDSLSVFGKLRNFSNAVNNLYSGVIARANTWLRGTVERIFGIKQEKPITEVNYGANSPGPNNQSYNQQVTNLTNSLIEQGTAAELQQTGIPVETQKTQTESKNDINRVCNAFFNNRNTAVGGIVGLNEMVIGADNLQSQAQCKLSFDSEIKFNSEVVADNLKRIEANGEVLAVTDDPELSSGEFKDKSGLLKKSFNTSSEEGKINPYNLSSGNQKLGFVQMSSLSTADAFNITSNTVNNAKPQDPGNNVNWKSIFSELFQALLKDIGDFITNTLLGGIRFLFGSIAKFLSNLNLPSWLKGIVVDPIVAGLREAEGALTNFVYEARDKLEQGLKKEQIAFDERYCKFYWSDEMESGELARLINAGIQEECQKRGLNFGFPEDETKNRYRFDRSSCRTYYTPTQDAEWNSNLSKYGNGNLNTWIWNCQKRNLETPKRVPDPNVPNNQTSFRLDFDLA